MAELKKVEIQLLDSVTGQFIEAVNPLTSASAVTFTDGKTFQEKLSDGSLRGQQGAQGIQGPKGDTGNPGSKIYNISGAPATSIGLIGDWAINTTNGDIFEKTSSALWTNRGNIKGPQGLQGAQGSKGDTGSQGLQGIQGPKGDVGARGAQGVKGDKGHQGVQGLKGDKGEPGDGIKVGATIATATDKKIFLKVVG